jgi:hypothetical protein
MRLHENMIFGSLIFFVEVGEGVNEEYKWENKRLPLVEGSLLFVL